MGEIRFDGKVAIVTGAGGGLGRAHALELARRGAKVVVNDLGGAVDGTGGNSAAAEAVVAEIEALGGEAFANGCSVSDETGVQNMIDATMDKWGRIDILIANAGILRDKSFGKMTLDDFRAVVDVHLMGSVIPIKKCWDIFKEQQYGRILVTTSSTGLYGNFGQANYGAAKLALVGLMNTLEIEGAKDNIRINSLAPVAGTRMTEGLMPEEVFNMLKPETISPGVMTLLDEDAPTGTIFTAGAGVFSTAKIFETTGAFFGKEDQITSERVREHWDKVSDEEGQEAYENGGGQTMKIITTIQKGAV